MLTIDANKNHSGFSSRLAITLAILKKEDIKIENIRINDEEKGLTNEDVFYLTVLSQISNAKTKGITVGSTEVEFSPNTIKKANQINFKYPAHLTVMLPYLLLLYHDTDQKISLLGPTNNENKLSIDYFQNIIIPMLNKINIHARLEITKRGYNKDIGKSILYTKKTTKVNDFILLEKGELEHSSIKIHSYGYNETVNNYIEEGIKNTLLPKEIIIDEYISDFVENNSFNKGYGADAILIYENTILGTNVSSHKKQPTQLGKELADKVISIYTRDTPLDLNSSNMIIPFLVLHNKKFKIICPKKDTYLEDCLYICETLFGLKYTKEEREKDILLESI